MPLKLKKDQIPVSDAVGQLLANQLALMDALLLLTYVEHGSIDETKALAKQIDETKAMFHD